LLCRLGVPSVITLLRAPASVALLFLLNSRPASADQPVYVSAQAFGGLENGLGLAVAGPDRRIDGEVSHAFTWRGEVGLTDASLSVRLLGTAAKALAVRAGYLHGRVHYVDASPDISHGFDLGVRLSGRSPAGHSVAAELGLEEVFRQSYFYCCDSAGLAASSFGVRVMLAGEVALARHLSLFARLGVRTAAHILEIRILPLAMAGMAVNF
jgi:hypothetical protein